MPDGNGGRFPAAHDLSPGRSAAELLSGSVCRHGSQHLPVRWIYGVRPPPDGIGGKAGRTNLKAATENREWTQIFGRGAQRTRAGKQNGFWVPPMESRCSGFVLDHLIWIPYKVGQAVGSVSLSSDASVNKGLRHASYFFQIDSFGRPWRRCAGFGSRPVCRLRFWKAAGQPGLDRGFRPRCPEQAGRLSQQIRGRPVPGSHLAEHGCFSGGIWAQSAHRCPSRRQRVLRCLDSFLRFPCP